MTDGLQFGQSFDYKILCTSDYFVKRLIPHLSFDLYRVFVVEILAILCKKKTKGIKLRYTYLCFVYADF